jgi:hypothetical protein
MALTPFTIQSVHIHHAVPFGIVVSDCGARQRFTQAVNSEGAALPLAKLTNFEAFENAECTIPVTVVPKIGAVRMGNGDTVVVLTYSTEPAVYYEA